MSNLHSPIRPIDSVDADSATIRGRVGRLAAAATLAGVLTTSLAVGTTASAQSPKPIGDPLPTKQLPIEQTSTEQISAKQLPVKPLPAPVDPTGPIDFGPKYEFPEIDRFPQVPLPCFGWWCEAPLLPLPDYKASFDPIPNPNGWYEGQKAVPYYVTIRNIGGANPGEVWTTLASRDGNILGVERVDAWRTDIEVQPVSDTARWSAPMAVSFLDDAWVVADTNGIAAHSGYADNVYLRVWMQGWDRPELIVSANDHVGVEQLGALTPTDYRHDEITRDNNRVEFNL